MPIYQYRCQTCNRTIEEMQKMSDPDIVTLKGCDVEKPCHLVRIMSVCSVRVNGIRREFDPPTAKAPITKSITRDWMNPDGTTSPMKDDEINHNYVGVNA